MRLEFIVPSDRAPEKLLANFEILDAPVPGLKITEGAVWQGEKGPWVSFNGRQFESQGKKRSVRFIQSMSDGSRAVWDRFEAAIIAQFNKWADAQEAASQSGEPAGDNPFA